MSHRAKLRLGLLLCGLLATGSATAQRTALDPTANASQPHRQRLYLKDGSYQMVMSYKVLRDRVRYVSAERAGDTEEIPLDLVDLPATKRWEQRQTLTRENDVGVVLDPELAAEEAERAAVTPEVAHTEEGVLRLPLEESVLALDTFRGTPELVPLAQQSSELNKTTGHGVVKLQLNPAASPHIIATLKGESADVQVHVERPDFYLRIGEAEDLPTGAGAITVDTHGASRDDRAARPVATSRFVIQRVEIRLNARVISSFRINQLGGGGRQDDLVETTATVLPGGHWVKVVPNEGLLAGEYCLLEVLSDRDLNTAVWDFGVHPRAPENKEAQLPQKQRPVKLQTRGPD